MEEQMCRESDSFGNDEDELDYEEIIDQNHLEIVTNLDVEQRHYVISYLRSKSIIDEEDCEIIRSTGNTRQQKVSILLDTIKRRGKSANKHFIDALEYEHPLLYEKCTGKKATSVMVPIPTFSSSAWIEGGMPGKELIDLDRTVLSKQLEQTSGGLHAITRSLHILQEEKNALQKKYMEAHNIIKQQEDHIEYLKDYMEKTTCDKTINEMESHCDESGAFIQAQQIRMMNHQQLIIGLQSHLLRQTEDIEKLKKENTFYKEENLDLKKEVSSLSLKCDNEQRNSMRLNQQVLNQHDELQQVDHFKKKNLALRMKIGDLLQEKEEVQAELEEFRKYSEVLNARYTMLTEERIQLNEHREEISSSFQSAQEQISELRAKLDHVEYENGYLQRTNDRLQSDVKTYRELQKTLHEERERLRQDCEQAWNALEKANEQMIKSKREHNESIHSQMIINCALDNKYRNLTEELDDLRLCLRQTNEELVRTKKTLGTARSNSSFSSTSEGERPVYKDIPKTEVKESKDKLFSHCVRERPKDKVSKNEESIDGDGLEMGDALENNIVKEHTLKRRANKELLDSIRRKLSQTESDVIPNKCQSLPKGLMTFNQLQLLYSNSLSQCYTAYNQESANSLNCDDNDTYSDGSKSPVFRTKMKKNTHAKVNGNSTKQVIRSGYLGYARSCSIGDTAHSRVFSDIMKNDNVFEVRRSSKQDCEAPCSLHSTFAKNLPLTYKSDADDSLEELEMAPSFRKRSFVIGAEYNRRRSVSAPTSPVFKC